MTALGLRLVGDRRALAAVEFAILAPVLLFLFGALADLGFSLRCRALLAGAVASGAQYAFNAGAGVSVATVTQVVQGGSSLRARAQITDPYLRVLSASNTCRSRRAVWHIEAVIQAQTLSGVQAVVTGPALFCVSGSPAELVATTAGEACADGSAPDTYLTIVATYVYTKLLPFQSSFLDPTLTETATVRLP